MKNPLHSNDNTESERSVIYKVLSIFLFLITTGVFGLISIFLELNGNFVVFWLLVVLLFIVMSVPPLIFIRSRIESGGIRQHRFSIETRKYSKLALIILGTLFIIIVIIGIIRDTRENIIGPLINYQTPTSTPTLSPVPTESITPVLHTITSTITPSTTITLTNTTTITPTSSETPTPTTSPTPTIIPPSSIKIGIIDIGPEYTFRDIADRLSGLGYYVEWIPPESDYYKLELFDIIYLPSGWSAVNFQIERQANDYLNYLKLKTQVGLLVEQPNFDGTFVPKILPYEIEFSSNRYQQDDWPPLIIDRDHYITTRIEDQNMPGPMDKISAIDEKYGVLVMGRKSSSPSLIFLNYNNNRILVSAGNTSTSSSVPYQISDQVLQRMIEWLAGAK